MCDVSVPGAFEFCCCPFAFSLVSPSRRETEEKKEEGREEKRKTWHDEKEPIYFPYSFCWFGFLSPAVVTVDRDSSVVYCGSQICRLGTENIGAERENLKVVYALFVLCYLLARFFLAVCKTPTVCLKRKRRSTASTPGTGSFAVSQCALGPCTSFLS